jgi:ankyrin repeat protein
LDELPESLDETYERLLKEIKKPNRDHARRLLQCLVVAIRPLRVEELAEVLAVDFDDVEGIPRLNPNWRWEDEEQALLSSCSSLIVIVGTDDSRVVQFSHFSVKEFLTSTRLADSSKDVSRYHIDLEPAHMILAQACMGIWLQTDNCVEENGIEKMSSLAGYAAEHWVTHAQFERVSSLLQKAMEYLFDLDKPYFAAWVELHDIDIKPVQGSSSLHWFATDPTSSATPLYYASLCGFQDLVEHLAVKHPWHVNTSGGFYVTPVVAALAGRHFQTAKFLHHNGAHLDVRGQWNDTLLHSPAWYGDVEMVQVLLDYKVDVNTRNEDGETPLHVASYSGCSTRIHDAVQSLPDTVQLLLEHGADINTWALDNSTPLHKAAEYGRDEVVRVLLERSANIGAKDNEGRTPLHNAVEYGRDEVVRVLLERGSNVGAKDNEGWTPLHKAARRGANEVVRVLLKHGATVDAKDNEGRTPFHHASVGGHKATVKLLLEYGAKKGVIPSSTSSLCLPW